MQIFVNSVERLNSPVYSAPPCARVAVRNTSIYLRQIYIYITFAAFFLRQTALQRSSLVLGRFFYVRVIRSAVYKTPDEFSPTVLILR